ncbi:MAG TPA: threonine synthase [Actinomycetota bacterium]|nr:threonine synthase [Actinomycetota bacterium]
MSDPTTATLVADSASNIAALRCRECGRTYDVSPQHVCEMCFGPLEVVYDYQRIAATCSRASIEAGPQSIWRYEALLPAVGAERVDIGAGWTRLRPAPRLAAELGLDKLWIKSDAGNPTHSFKDRVVSVALSAARSFGYDVASCASTGNLANAVAAHAAAVGMRSVVFIPADLEPAKIAATSVYGGTVIGVDGSYDDVNRVCAELSGEREWAFVNMNLRPFYAEGSKSLAFEVAEQLGWRRPEAVVVPIASGSLLTKIAKGFRELDETGLVPAEAPVTVHGAQAAGCSPVATAFESGASEVQPVRPSTIAKSLAIGSPADGHYALEEVRSSGGAIASVPEADIAEGIRLLARTEGIFTETAGGVTIAALERLVASGAIGREQETVALITGIGLKTLDALPPPVPTATVRPSIDEVNRVLEEVLR